MAKLTRLPSQAIIDGLKGKLDFYVWMGIPVARSWPKSPGSDRAPGVKAGWAAWTWASQNWQSLDDETRTSFNRMAAGTNMTGRDLFIKSYLTKAHLRNV